jgi:hypothetical protein
MKTTFCFFMVMLIAVSCNPAYADSSAGSIAEQGQGQAQSITLEGSTAVRYLPTAPIVPVSVRPQSIYGNANYSDPGAHFFDMGNLVTILNNANIENATANDLSDIEIVTQLLITEGEVSSTEFGGVVTFSLCKAEELVDARPIAAISVKADDDDTINSASLAVAIANKARELGGSRVVFMREGSSKRLTSFGWGIGFSGNYATVTSNSQGHGSVGAGGTGISGGSAEYLSLPYLTALILE